MFLSLRYWLNAEYGHSSFLKSILNKGIEIPLLKGSVLMILNVTECVFHRI